MYCTIDSKRPSIHIPLQTSFSRPGLCTNCARMRLLHHDCAHWSGTSRRHFVRPTVELLQGFALHLQLHLRVLLEDLRVALAKHLRYPLIGYSCCTQPCGISGSKVVNPKVRNLCPLKSCPPNGFESRLVLARNPVAREKKRSVTRN